MTCTTIIPLIRDVLVSIAAFTTSSVAILGLRKWKLEVRGKADFEVARSLIRATYKLRDAISIARSPLLSNAEFPTGYIPEAKNSSQQKAQAWAYVYENRFKPVYDAAQEFDAQALEAEALWGAEIKSKVANMRQCARDLQVSMNYRVENEASGGLDFKTDSDFAKSVRADVSSANRDNPLSTKISKSVLAIEEFVRPRLAYNEK